MKLNVAVLGCTGMVGHMVVKHLSKNPLINVVACSRTVGKLFNVSDADLSNVTRDMDYIINCVGAIWQANPSRREAFITNSQFPWRLQESCDQTWPAKLIHASTDCVFSGATGSSDETSVADATDDYGLSKLVGEPTSGMVIRTSIIGPEVTTKRSFFEWVRTNAGRSVDGYVNHTWNGLTSLEYAKACERIIMGGLWHPGVHHVFSNEALTKRDMVQKVSDAFDLGVTVVPTLSDDSVNRSLSTVKTLCSELCIPTFDQMLVELQSLVGG